MRLFWTFLILFQIWFAAQTSLQPFNAARGSFRREERAAALKAMSDNPTPETKAAVQKEQHLNGQHIVRGQLVQGSILLGVFLVLDVAGYYGWKNFRQNFGYKTPSAAAPPRRAVGRRR